MRLSRPLGWLLGIFIALAALLAYAASNLQSYLDANRDVLAGQASQALGREVRFDTLRLSLRRGLGIEIDDLAIAEDPRFGTGDMVSARRTLVRVQLIPALFGRFEISRVLLDTPRISLVQTAEGLNANALGKAREIATEAPAEENSAPPRIAVALLDIDDGTLSYVDRTAKPPREIVVRHVDFRASDLSFGEELRFELSAALFHPETPDVKASGTIGPVDAAAIDASPLDVVIHMEQFDSRRAVALAGGLSGLEAEGPLTANAHIGGTIGEWTAHITVHGGAARLRWGSTIDKPAGTTASFTATVEGDSAGVLRAAPIALEIGDSQIAGEASVTPGKDGVSGYDARIQASNLALADWSAISPGLRDARVEGLANLKLGVRGNTASGLGSLTGNLGLENVGASPANGPSVSQVNGNIVFQGKAIDIEPTSFLLGGAAASLKGRVADITAPRLEFSLTSERFPLAAITGGEDNRAADALENMKLAGVLANAGDSPRLDATLSATRARMSGLPATDLTATLIHANGISRVEPLGFDTCGGRVEGSASYTAPTSEREQPRIRVNARANQIQLERASSALTATDTPLVGGKVSFDINVDGAGTSWESLSQALSGKGNFEWIDGALRGTNLPESVLENITGVPGLSGLLPASLRKDFPQIFGRKDTKFDQIAAAFRVEKGRIATRNLGVKAHDFRIRADGSIGLDLSTDLAATLTTSPTLSRRLIAEVGALRYLADTSGDVAIPFRLSGTLPAAKATPDTSALAAAVQKGVLGSIGEKLLGGGLQKKPRPSPRSP